MTKGPLWSGSEWLTALSPVCSASLFPNTPGALPHQGFALTAPSAWHRFPQPVSWPAPPFPSGPFSNIPLSQSLPWFSIFHIPSSLLRICHCIACYIFNTFILSSVIPSKCKSYQGRDPCFIHHCISSLWSGLGRYLLRWRINERIHELMKLLLSLLKRLVEKKWLQIVKF